ncbi:biliverdin-producing heme oxygenase [Methylobacterium planeticum]|uniref:Biliverdin-producing heme oxygenase n=1 Tax=Methylobacterium planeticum TaxID=2615211 RepID=A0A6N6MUJ5_9HYPH|nr:biliverdin-producing heme oxygenase [Methylobacterium planeticum]KAB1074789.1 biliverdin-producing heme oxygenase [Methylobacterium planeticum]
MSLHQHLRAATAAAHQDLERSLDWEARVATLAGYRDLLARFRGFHGVYEPAIGAALADEAFFAPRRRLARLDADLSDLGLDARLDLPGPPAPRLDGPDAAIGALYVLEGSTLGGQMIGRRIAALHGFDAATGCRYYLAHGNRTGAMWSAFRTHLDSLAAGPDAEAAAVAAANATFEALRLWLCRDLPAPA